ncbi:hypothetical protein GCM10022240_24220 [Microbacterium kribbense]|uniref:Uncharacterized protein n=1 Tax=Microbacterium kribbense TaxID=433645 RepID=A0ABP7GPB7_9MICO
MSDAALTAVPPGPRPIRRIGPPDAPWSGVLAQDAAGRACVLVDAAQLAHSWTWRGAPDGHLAAARDLVRHAEGHDVVLPMCTEQLSVFLTRRSAGDVPLTPGESVTVAVSVLRGTAEAVSLCAREGDAATGSWWLADDGRPLLVAGGEVDAAPEAQGLLQRVREETAAAPGHDEVCAALDAAVAALDEPRGLGNVVPDLEEGLLAAAEPQPLATTVFAPALARAVAVDRPPAPALDAPDGGRWWDAIAPHVDAALPEMASRAATALWRRLRTDRPGRRRHPVMWAAAAGAIVLGVGVMWPDGAPAPANADAAQLSTAGSTPTAGDLRGPDRAASAEPGPPASSADPPALAAIADALLVERAGCADAACRVRTQEQPGRTLPAGVIDLDADQRTLTLLDDFGGAAVLRAHADFAEMGDQLVVIVRKDGKWLLRDIHDVAQQPVTP